jgi:hypothetical protein
MIDHIQVSCGMGAIGSPTITYKDNATHVAQMQTRYIKTNYTKHISLNFFTHINYKKVEILLSCKLNCVMISLIYLQSLYLYPLLKNVLKALVCANLDICKVYGGESL